MPLSPLQNMINVHMYVCMCTCTIGPTYKIHANVCWHSPCLLFTGATVAITPVSILHSCNYENNCQARSGARSWCQIAGPVSINRISKPQDSAEQLVLSISNATDNDNGVYQCSKCDRCCPTEDENIFSELNVTVYGESAAVGRS